MNVTVTIIHGAGDNQTTHEWSLPALPRPGDAIYLDGYKSGEVRHVEFQLADDNGFIQTPKILVRLR